MEPLVAMLSNRLRLLKAGVSVAVLKGRDAIPSHALAMSSVLAPAAFVTYDLPYTEALRYLHGEAVALPSDVQRSYVIVTYRGVSLGFVKHLGNRANNLYPYEWRIRSTHFPATEQRIV